MTFPVGSSVTVNGTAFGANGSNSFCLEFFVKYDTLTTNTTLVQLGGQSANQFNLSANSSVLQISATTQGTRGIVNAAIANTALSSNVAFLSNTWYHIAYMGTGSNTYLGINGRVYNLGTSGGDGVAADGLWEAGTLATIGNSNASSNSANIYISNLRLVSNGTVYNVQGFAPPNTQLTAIANSRILLANSTFRNEVNATALTTTGSPSITTGDVVYRFPLMSDVQFANAVPTQYINTTSSSATETYKTRILGSGANQINKQIKTTITRSVTTSDANTNLNYIVRERGSGANQVYKLPETLPRTVTTSDANTNLNYVVRTLGSGANQIKKQVKTTVTRVYYDKDGRIINQFTWG